LKGKETYEYMQITLEEFSAAVFMPYFPALEKDESRK
jgi:hypothetical protein